MRTSVYTYPAGLGEEIDAAEDVTTTRLTLGLHPHAQKWYMWSVLCLLRGNRDSDVREFLDRLQDTDCTLDSGADDFIWVICGELGGRITQSVNQWYPLPRARVQTYVERGSSVQDCVDALDSLVECV